ncbi:MAG: ABC transporter substrate-binding protein, partial [Ignisphaera sp.]
RLSEEVNAPVIVVDYGSAGYLDLELVKRALKLLGKVLGRANRAEELCRFIDMIVNDLRKRTENVLYKPNVYVGAISYKGKQPFTSTQSNFPPLALLNTTSIADKISGRFGFISLDFEYILNSQPDIIFIDLNNLDVVLNDFAKDSAKYCSLKAFREGRVYSILPFNYYHTNIATALADTYYIGKILYPEEFANIDPAVKANEIFKVFLGRELYEEFVRGFGRGFASLSDLFNCG